MIAGGADLLQGVLYLLCVVEMRGSDVCKSHDRIHGSPDIMRHIGEKSALCRIRASCSVQSPFEQSPLLQFSAHLILDTGYADKSLRTFLRTDHAHPEIFRPPACDRPEYKTAEPVTLKSASEALKAHGSDKEIVVIRIDAAVRDLKHSKRKFVLEHSRKIS